VAADEVLRREADEFARLLSDARGAEILAALQRLRRHQPAPQAPPPAAAPPPASGGGAGDAQDVGVWRTERVAAGIALRRSDVEANPWHWARADYIPPAAGAQRVVVMGESVARGWGYDPVLNPAMALGRQLAEAAPGQYQCVDLAQAGAMAEDLTRLVGQLPATAPDVVVVMAGNNWGCFPGSRAELVSELAEGVAEHGYAAMRQRFIDTVMLPRARGLTEGLLALHAEHGTRVIVVIPEFNLRGWAPPQNVEVPLLASGRLARWYEIRARASRACDERRWPEAAAAAHEMAELDGGTSPVTGQLLARAAIGLGDGALARAGLEASRDALAGLGICYTPRIIREIRDLLAKFAAGNGFRCVDLGKALASEDIPELPDPGLFWDYCHLSDTGIERAMSAVADAVLGLPEGTTRPGPPPADAEFLALMRIVAAAQAAFLGQPAATVDLQLRLALAAEPTVRTVLTWLAEILAGTGPMWARPAVEPLTGLRPLASLFGHVALTTSLPAELWTLRECLEKVLGRTPDPAPGTADLLADPFSEGHRPPNLTPGRAYHTATARRSRLAFGVAHPADGLVDLVYRGSAAAAPDATVTVNDHLVGTLPPAASWMTARLEVPAAALRPGVNWLSIDWPDPDIDAERALTADCSAMARGELPFMLPAFGELFDARVTLSGHPGRPR
jgi:hypothetical protein